MKAGFMNKASWYNNILTVGIRFKTSNSHI